MKHDVYEITLSVVVPKDHPGKLDSIVERFCDMEGVISYSTPDKLSDEDAASLLEATGFEDDQEDYED